MAGRRKSKAGSQDTLTLRSFSQPSLLEFSDLAPTLTVAQLARRIKDVVEADSVLGNVWVRGEISNFIHANSGHVYFTLKDREAAIRCVMWRHDAIRVPRMPESGTAVEVHGTVSMYEARGDVQLYVDEIKPVGAGALYQEFLLLKEKLEKKGWFAPERKRALPQYPHTIGVVTSRDGAVLRDICHILRRRYPLVEVLLRPTLVQGTTAAGMIADAIQTLCQYQIDLLIVARGGGSFEDLHCFNAECVAEAIFKSRVPVISAVGHETDFTIADFVADVRAPTPSAAAEICVADQRELRAAIYASAEHLSQLMRDQVGNARVRLGNSAYSLRRVSPQTQIASDRQRIDELEYRLSTRMQQVVALNREQMNGSVRHLTALNPKATLARGYAIVREKETGKVVTKKDQVDRGQAIRVRVSDGEFEATKKD